MGDRRQGKPSHARIHESPLPTIHHRVASPSKQTTKQDVIHPHQDDQQQSNQGGECNVRTHDIPGVVILWDDDAAAD
jgi:hypothetical protein